MCLSVKVIVPKKDNTLKFVVRMGSVCVVTLLRVLVLVSPVANLFMVIYDIAICICKKSTRN